MARFEDAINITLDHEGGLSNNPKDPGGITNFGISLKFYKVILPSATADDIKNLTRDMAIEIYRKCFWDKQKYGLITSQLVANKVFDICVNMGESQANSCLQKAVKIASNQDLLVDGILGSKSFYAINSSQPDALHAALKCFAFIYYQNLVIANPKLDVFLKGWINRVCS